MSKKYLMILSIFAIVLSVPSSMAEVFQTQSPIYTDGIGRSHFLGRGGYSSIRHIDMGAAQADAINEVSKDMQRVEDETKKTINQVENDITDIIKERPTVPVSSKTKATFTTEERKMDPSASFGYGATYLPSSGVNASKTIYTDEIGRLHFFRKENQIKE